MRRVPLALVTLAVAALARAADAPPAPGALQAGERVFDAGKIERGTKLRHEFVLKNGGTEALSIDAKPG